MHYYENAEVRNQMDYELAFAYEIEDMHVQVIA